MARRLFSSSVLFSLCLTGYCLAAEYERRIWTDKSGKHQISATFIDVIDGKVRLERPNGDISRVPLEKLSKADREYVASAGKPEEEPEPETPVLRGLQVGDKIEIDQAGRWQLGTVVEIDYKFEIVKVQVPGAPFPYRAHGVEELRDPKTLQQPILVKPASPVSALKTIRPDYTKMDRLLADGKSADRIAADPLERPESLWSPRAVRLGGQAGILGSLSRPSDFAITYSPTPMAMVVFAAPGVGEEGPSQVELVDLTSRKSVLKGPAPPGTGKVRISPGGGSLATLAAENIGARSNGRVAFWKLKDKDISHWISFSPYVMNSWPDAEPQWVAWLDEEKFLSVNQEGQLILWQVENAQAIYEMQIDGGTKPILTHGRKHLVIPTSLGVRFHDAQSGELIAVVGSGDFRRAEMAFSPSGVQLAIVSAGFVDVLDVTTGEATRSFPCELLRGSGEIGWIDEEYLFTSNGLIIHVPFRLIAWKYEIYAQLIKIFGEIPWILLDDMGNGSQILMPLELPPGEAVEAIASIDEENLLVVKPGDSISIDVQIQDDTFLAEEVRKAITEALIEAGMTVKEDSELKLVARTKTGDTEQVRYRDFGAFLNDPGEILDVTSRVYELELLLNGAEVWRRESVHAAPMHLRLEQGETTRTAIDRVLKPTGANFRGRLPSYVVRSEYREPLGTSKLLLAP